MSERKPRETRRWVLAGALVAVAAVVTIAVTVFNHHEGKWIGQQLYVPRATRLTPEAALLQQYIRIDTTNPPGNEIAGARFLQEKLRAAGVASEIIESAPGRASLYARLKGRSAGDGLMLLNHIDVVPAKGRWRQPPFSGGVALNMIHGRGAIDMKGIAICQLEAFLSVARSGRTPRRDLVFLATADEEAGGTFGVAWLIAHRPDVFGGVRYVLNEGGITEMQRETLTYFGIETGAKQVVHVELSGPDSGSLEAARRALEPYFDPRDAARVLPGVRRYLAAVASTRVENQETLSDIDRTITAGKFWLAPEMYRFLMTNTIRAFGVKERPDGTWLMEVYLFNLPDEDPDARLRWLSATVAPFGVKAGSILQKQGPSPISDDDSELFRLLIREVKRTYGDVPAGPLVLALYSNDSRFLRARGMTCYGFQPFLTDFFQSLSIHGTDERVRVDWFSTGVGVMRRVVQQVALGDSDTIRQAVPRKSANY